MRTSRKKTFGMHYSEWRLTCVDAIRGRIDSEGRGSSNMDNYRGISLMSCTLKILLVIVSDRISSAAQQKARNASMNPKLGFAAWRKPSHRPCNSRYFGQWWSPAAYVGRSFLAWIMQWLNKYRSLLISAYMLSSACTEESTGFQRLHSVSTVSPKGYSYFASGGLFNHCSPVMLYRDCDWFGN